MSKKELRTQLIEHCQAPGDLDREIEELSRFKNSTGADDIITITVGCGELLTLICC